MVDKYWIIKEKNSGRFLPVQMGRYGFTHVEPCAYPFSPRLFSREQDAKTALTWWMKGIITVTRTHTQNWDGEYEIDEDWHTQEVPERSREDFEIVPVELKVAA